MKHIYRWILSKKGSKVLIVTLILAILYHVYFSRERKIPLPECPIVMNTPSHLSHKMSKENQYSTNLLPNSHIIDKIDCEKIINGNENELAKARDVRPCEAKIMTENEYLKETADCEGFRYRFGYDDYTVTDDEESFPLAFSILTFEHIHQTEHLLRAIYRPQNYYCIHVDLNAKVEYLNAVQSISKCFDNIFMASHPIRVKWSEFPVLEAEIHCMQDLIRYKNWRYFINLTGREFPLRTNWELVQIFKAYNGANDIDGTLHHRPIIWTKYVWWNENLMTWWLKDPPPKGFNIAKGSTHIAATRGFIEYIVNNPLAKQLLEWMRDIRAPDEHYFPTLNHNPHKGVPGAYKGDPDLKRFLTRYKVWEDASSHCDGRWWRFICNFGVGDLSTLVKRPELFVNKFRYEFDPIAFQCMEIWYHNRTRHQKLNGFNVSFYKQQPWVNNHS